MEEQVEDNAQAAFDATAIDTPDTPDENLIGSVIVRVMPGETDVQKSNFDAGSFQIENTGDKRIVAVYFDHSTALYTDSVWDADGTGGDSAFKDLQIDLDTGTEVVAPNPDNIYFQPAQDAANPDPLFADGVAEGDADGGFRGLLLTFNASADDANTGFTNGEEVRFSGDMDPNSIAGFNKSTVDSGSNPSNWDVGGVSGAELIGTTITVMFSDGTTATAQLMGDDSQGGAQALITQDSPEETVTLTVNGVGEGGTGVYDETDPVVTVTGEAGSTVRVVLTKGHNPVENTQSNAKAIVEQRLADEAFQANNAAEFQTADVLIGEDGTATVTFDYDDIDNSITQPFAGDDQLPLGFVAAVIDPENGDLPLGPVTAPIYLTFGEQPSNPNAPVAVDDTAAIAADAGPTEIAVLSNDSDADGDSLFVISVNDAGMQGQATLENGVVRYDPNGQFDTLQGGRDRHGNHQLHRLRRQRRHRDGGGDHHHHRRQRRARRNRRRRHGGRRIGRDRDRRARQ